MPGSITGTDMRKDEGAYEKSDVVDKVAQTLAKFGEVEDSTPDQTEEVTETKVSTPKPEDKKKDEQESAETEDSTSQNQDKVSADEETTKEDKAEEKPAIPDNYYRAVIHQGWKPEQISKLYENDPEGALQIFEKIYNDTNNLSQQFAQLGRKAREMQAQPVQPVQPAQSKPQTFDPEKFKKDYEDDPASAIASAFAVLQAKPEAQPVQPVQGPSQKDEWSEWLAAIEQLNGFFGAEDLKPFVEHYGKSKSLNWGDLTPDQYAHRQAVVNRADEILAGAELLQKGMTVREAVELAHMELSAPMLHKIVRQDILKSVQKKAKGVTMRPSASKAIVAPKEGAKLSEEQVIANAEARLADLRSRGA